ncbi:MAG: hypothetical protein AAFY41_14330, partial [Bacteroidota bacterium]
SIARGSENDIASSRDTPLKDQKNSLERELRDTNLITHETDIVMENAVIPPASTAERARRMPDTIKIPADRANTHAKTDSRQPNTKTPVN